MEGVIIFKENKSFKTVLGGTVSSLSEQEKKKVQLKELGDSYCSIKGSGVNSPDITELKENINLLLQKL